MGILNSAEEPLPENPFLGQQLRTTIVDYRNAVGTSPTDPDDSNTLGDLYVRAGRVEDAIACFSQAANAYKWHGSILKAIAVLKKISRLNPGDPNVSIRLGDLFARQGLIGEARVSYLAAGDNKYISGDAEGAIKAYEKVVAIDASNAALMTMLGGLYAEAGSLRQARAVFVNARKEHLKKGHFGLAREAASRARAIELSMGIDSGQADPERRRETRYPIRLGTLVFPQNRKWREFTQTVNISRSGLRFRLSHPVEPDTILRLQLPLPSHLDLDTNDNSVYATDAIVCNRLQTESGTILIGAEFGTVAPVTAA
jgi:tetratricopeptide (TPR) repeat protein